MPLKIQALDQKISVSSPVYHWEWDVETDIFVLYDSKKRLIGRGHQQPLILTTANGNGRFFQNKVWKADRESVTITYRDDDTTSHLTVAWRFRNDHILLEPLSYQSSLVEEIVQVVYFPEAKGDTYRPSLYSRYAIVPGLSMSPNISPVIDLHSGLSTTAVLGAGAMRGPGLTQQWGLPAHYFCMFNTAERWNAIGAKQLQSGAACWGLADLPEGDFRLEIREIGLSPVLNLRHDLWKHSRIPESLGLVGFKFMITFGEHFHEAIRSYYKILIREKIIKPRHNVISAIKSRVLSAPQYNTWGVESAKAMQPEELNEDIVLDIFQKLQASGMKARMFVIDDKWEGRYGELRHDEARFPNFVSMLERIRQEGYFIGLWAAFLRCQDPAAVGLSESHLLQTPEGKPLWLSHQAARYGIFDVTQPAVQNILKERAREFIRSYQPDLIKFDFGYELPSLDVAAPADMRWSGERLLQKGLEVIVGAMKEVNPELVIMYYGLSPLLIDYYDLHSPDDLVYCGGDYDLETNRRILFSSLCGELGMPTYGSSGYDWLSAPEIWFDSVPSGTLGSLQSFEGDENGDLPRPEWIAKYNGLSAILRNKACFSIQPVEAKWQGGLRAAFSPSWERVENGRTVLLALRTHRFDGQPASPSYKAVLDRNVKLVIASMTEDDIAWAERLGIVPFGDGSCTIQHTARHSTATVIEHYFSGSQAKTQIVCHNQQLQLNLQQVRNDEIVEWLEIIFKE